MDMNNVTSLRRYKRCSINGWLRSINLINLKLLFNLNTNLVQKLSKEIKKGNTRLDPTISGQQHSMMVGDKTGNSRRTKKTPVKNSFEVRFEATIDE